MSGRLVLLRHGQSYGNVERRLDTRPPGAALDTQFIEHGPGIFAQQTDDDFTVGQGGVVVGNLAQARFRLAIQRMADLFGQICNGVHVRVILRI